MGVVIRRWVWLVVVVRRYIDFLILLSLYSTCISSFFAAVSLFLCSFLNGFSFFYYYSIIILQ